jgi:hypothetical protein
VTRLRRWNSFLKDRRIGEVVWVLEVRDELFSESSDAKGATDRWLYGDESVRGLCDGFEWVRGCVPHEVKEEAVAKLAVAKVDKCVPIAFAFVEATALLCVGEFGD